MQLKAPMAVGLVAILLAATVGCESTPARSTVKTSAAPASMQDEAAATGNQWNIVGEPGEEHHFLDALEGHWSFKVTIMGAKDQDPVVRYGAVDRTWILGGRFLESRPKVAGPAGTLEGVSLMGYNAFDGVFEFVWVDNQSTAVSLSKGRFDEKKNRLTVFGEQRDPSNGFLHLARTVYDLKGEDGHTVTGYTTDQWGVEVKTFVVEFTR